MSLNGKPIVPGSWRILLLQNETFLETEFSRVCSQNSVFVEGDFDHSPIATEHTEAFQWTIHLIRLARKSTRLAAA